jgi:ABC-type Mn2+/Zn2+ transport system permease subunit
MVVIGAAVIFIVTAAISRKLLLGVVSEDLARSQKINVSKINLIYLLLIALVVALGVKFLGTLLTGAMVIIPAVTAKNIAGSLKSFYLYSISIGIISSVVGIITATLFGIPSGPAVVLVSVVLFILSYLFRKK